MPLGNPIRKQNESRMVSVLATEGQTVFTVQGGYIINQISVFRNGVRLSPAEDFTAGDGSTVTLNNAANIDDRIDFHIFDRFTVQNAIIGAASTQTINGDLVLNGKLFGQLDVPSINLTGIVTATKAIIGTGVTIDQSNIDTVGIITATTFSGALTGAATRVTVTDQTGDTTCNVLFAQSATGNQLPHTNANLTFNSTSGALTATSVNGNIVGGTVSGTTGTFTGDVDIADKIVHTGDTNTAIRFPAADTFTVETAGSERIRIDSSGRLLVGLNLDHASESTIVARGNSTSGTSYSVLDMRRGETADAIGDVLGYIRFSDSDIPSSNNNYALIYAAVDAASSGVGDNPGRLVFSTTADGGSGASERLRIDSNGNIGAGTGNSTIDEALCVERSGNVTIMAECNTSGSGANAAFRLKSADSSSDWYMQSGNVTSGGLRFYDGNGGSEKLRITSEGAILISTAGTRRNTKGSSQFQALLIEGTTNNTTRMTMIRSSNDDNGPEIQLVKTRGTSVGSVTKPNQNDYIGALVFIAADDSDLYARAAEISVQATGTPANDSCPSDLVFSTTSASASAPTTKMRITAGGRLGVGIDSPDELLHLKSAASAGACIELDNNGNYKSQLKTSSDALEVRGPQAINFYTGNNDGASSTIRLNIDNTGRLRINGATTSAKISMNVDDGSGLGSGSDGIRINSGTPNAQFVRLGSSYSYHGVLGSGGASMLYSYDALRILADTSNPITFHTGGALRMHILANGRIYMGTTNTQQHDQNKVVVAGTKAFSAGIVQQQLTIVDENAYNTTNNGGAIGFQAQYHSNGSYTQMACIQGNKENNNSADYGGSFSISTRQNNGNMIEGLHIGSAGGPTSIRSQLYCNSELNLFKADSTPSHKYMDIGYLNNVFYIRRTNGGDGGHAVQMSITSAGVISGDFNDTSDEKLKENIVSVSDGSLALVKQLRPVTFDWKDSTRGNNQAGFIAQEVKTVIPKIVNGTEYNETEVNEKGQIISTGYSINTTGLVAHLTKALQELSAKNDALEARIAALEGS